MSALCHMLHLTSLAAALPTLLDTARQEQLSYEAFLTLALKAEMDGRDARARTRRFREARLPFPSDLERFDFRFQPSLSERVVRELASLNFVKTATNVVLVGPPGVGKTHLACGLARKALDAGHTVRFVTLRELSAQLGAPRGGRVNVIRRYSQPMLLVLDEMGYTQLIPVQAQALFDLVLARYEHRATLFTSNLTFAEWGGLLGDEVLATALLDRVLHHAEVIAINGRSYRMRERAASDRPTATP